jgi:acetyl-CoA acetyltransferase
MRVNPIKDQVAIVGVGSTGFVRDSLKSQNALALEACVSAIEDAGLTRHDIDGLVGTQPNVRYVAAALGFSRVTHYLNPTLPFSFSLLDAINAIYSGSCHTVLVYHSVYRSPTVSKAARSDPFRRNVLRHGAAAANLAATGAFEEADYSSLASRYLHDGGSREAFSRIAVNSRTCALDNPLASRRTPMTMEDYFESRMVREPLCLLDMDVPVDGADAFILTSSELATDLSQPPVLVHATATALVAQTDYDQIDLNHHGQHVVTELLQDKSDIWLDDLDLLYLYDGFTIIAVQWLESLGFCKPREANSYLAENWDLLRNRLMLSGRISVNTHGGNLSEGATQGSGHCREAVVQLRGSAGSRQVKGAHTALLAIGGFVFNATGLILRAE